MLNVNVLLLKSLLLTTLVFNNSSIGTSKRARSATLQQRYATADT